ncbi:MAG: insulinase family protein [Deltaproteobacteria bacterium]|nr:insulinase family protein [Deltaproteobacteria bacterium]
MQLWKPIAFLLLLPTVALAADTPVEPPDETVIVQGERPLPPGNSDNPNKPRMQLELDAYSLNSTDFIFPSGLRVIMQADHTEPLVGITMWIDRGSSSDPIGREGIAHYIEHLWFKSKHGEGIPKVWDLVKEMGCDINASTSNDWTNYMTICSSEFLPVMLKLESLRLTDTITKVSVEEMLTEREVVRNELRLRMEVGEGDMIRYLMEDVYPEGHPYHRETIGTHETIDAIQLSDIQEFVDLNYRPENTTLVVVGDFDLEEASSLILENFDLKNLHPDLTDEHIFFYPRPGVEEPKKSNPDDWYIGAWDPAAPQEKILSTMGEPVVRAAEKAKPPPLPAQLISTHDAPVDRPVVAVAWAVPGGYQGEDALWSQIAGTIGYQMWYRFQDPNQLRSLGGDDRIYTDPVSDQKAVSCGYWANTVNSTVLCFAELADDDVDAKKVGREMLDQVSEVWNEDVATSEQTSMGERFFNLSRMRFMRDVLLSLDVVSALRGRAFDIAEWAHYTGRPTYHSDMIMAATEGSLHQAKELAFAHLTRDRAVTSIMNPIPEEDMVVDSSETAFHGTQRGMDIVVQSAVDLDQVTTDFIKESTKVPDLSTMREKVLENGMRVVVMPHGEVPITRIRLLFEGGTSSDATGRYVFADRFMDYDDINNTELDPLQIAGEMTFTVAGTYTTANITASSRNVDGMMWILRQWVQSIRPYTAGKNDWIRRQKSSLSGSWVVGEPDWFVDHAIGEHWNPGHPITKVASYEDYDLWKTWGAGEARETLNQIYQPANTTMIIVGRLDPDEALAQAEEYFGGWRAKPGTTVGRYPPMPPPNPGKSARTLVFDDPGNSQTSVEYHCPVGPVDPKSRVIYEVMAQVIDDSVWRILREQAGATYGANSGLAYYDGGSARLVMSSMVQNDATPLAVKTFQRMVKDMEGGEIDHDQLTMQKLNKARSFGLNQQSVQQMTTRLTMAARNSWPWLESYGARLAAVDEAALQQAVQGCSEHAIITMQGPLDVIGPMLDEEGVEYEVYDWEAKADELLLQYDPKAHKKKMKKEAKEAAEEAEAAEEPVATENGEE